MENVENQNVEARRSFLKKVAYVAPAVVVLGSLTLPGSAQASTFTGVNNTYDNKGVLVKSTPITLTGNSGTGTIEGGTYGTTTLTVDQVKSVPYNGMFAWLSHWFPSLG
jgi:hypothetical protein